MGRKPKTKEDLPHHKVYTRLRSSKIHGVGVFSITNIKKGTFLFYGDDEDMVWIEKQEVSKLPAEIRKLYDDFCVIKDDQYGCPKNFNQLTVAWYLNEPKPSEKPNVGCNNDYEFFALRDIKKGEELTVDYSTYSEYPDPDRTDRR